MSAPTLVAGDTVCWDNAYGECECGTVDAVASAVVYVTMTTIGRMPRLKPARVFFQGADIQKLRKASP